MTIHIKEVRKLAGVDSFDYMPTEVCNSQAYRVLKQMEALQSRRRRQRGKKIKIPNAHPRKTRTRGRR